MTGDRPAHARHLLCAVAITTALAGCGDGASRSGHDAARGRELLRQYGCGACHEIPGVVGAHGTVGPSLERIGERVYIAGVLPNSREHMMRWIREASVIKPGTAMPDTPAPERDLSDMVAHLMTLR